MPFTTWRNGFERPRGVFDLGARAARVAELDALVAEPDFWDDQRVARRTMREAESLREEISCWTDLVARAESLEELADMAAEAGEEEMLAEIDRDSDALAKAFDRERTSLLFSGDYDDRGAVISISAGAGGTEATDWAEMLLRMYIRWSERHRFGTELLDRTEGDQTGLKSATLAVDGRRAFGWLRAERGVHRLVRISPYDAQKRRQTTFALVEVMPEVEDEAEVELNWDEIKVDNFRSSGAGGQHVQKTNSAVRLTHLPTGIVVTCQNERSATQNKETAAKVLAARLLERRLEEKEAELRKIKGEHVEAGWGNQIRSYVLHPYQMVKDHRTEVETSNTTGVLDGDLDTFMAAELEREATEAPIGGGPEPA